MSPEASPVGEIWSLSGLLTTWNLDRNTVREMPDVGDTGRTCTHALFTAVVMGLQAY